MGKYSKISGNTFYRNFPTRPTYGDPTYGGLTVNVFVASHDLFLLQILLRRFVIIKIRN